MPDYEERLKALTEYFHKSLEIEKELPGNIQYNPQATNWLLSLSGKDRLNKTYMTGLTNIPNTLVVEGHGDESLSVDLKSGLAPDKSSTNKLATAIRERQFEGEHNLLSLALNKQETEGGLSLGELAKAMGNQTNEVKRVVFMSCFNAGYTPAEIRNYFPNADDIIASSTEGKLVSLNAFYDLFRKEQRVGDVTKLLKSSPLFNYSSTGTNEIKQASDWLNPIPAWLKYVDPPYSQNTQELNP